MPGDQSSYPKIVPLRRINPRRAKALQTAPTGTLNGLRRPRSVSCTLACRRLR
jgi:hypothetical protein